MARNLGCNSILICNYKTSPIRGLPDVTGSGFTPNNEVRYVAEAIFGRVNHAPFPIGGFARTDGNGSFVDDSIDIRFASVRQPNNPRVVIRAIDRAGISAVGFTNGFTT